MDHELIAYLDARFRDIAQQISGLREEMSQQFGREREKTDGQFTSLREDMSQQFAREREETNGQFTSLRGELDVRFTRVEETARHAHVLIESLHGDVRLLAEGMSGFDGKLEALRTELKEEIGEVRILLQQSYRHLDRRIG